MILRPYILYPEWLGSDRVVGLRDHVKVFFLKIGNVTDGAGRFEADAAMLRAALYPKELQKVSEKSVKGMLEILHVAGLVRLYTRAGKGYGEVSIYKQTDSQRKVRFPGPDSGELNFAGVDEGEVDPPPRRTRKKNRIEEKGEGAERAKPPAPISNQAAPESHAAWLERLVKAWPHLDVEAELGKALLKKAKQGGQLEREWFERTWLPGCSVVVTRADVFAAKKPEGDVIPPEGPEDWKLVIEGTALGDSVWAGEITQWGELNKTQQAFVLDRLEKRRAG